MKRYSSVTLHESMKNPISKDKLNIISTKIQIYIKKILSAFFNQKQIEATLLHFRNGFHDKSAQTDRSKEMLFPILKGL